MIFESTVIAVVLLCLCTGSIHSHPAAEPEGKVNCIQGCSCYHQGVYCDKLSSNENSSTFFQQVPRDAASIEVKGAKFKYLNTQKTFPHVVTLTLESCHISAIQEGFFSHMPSLRYLNLKKNNITSVKNVTTESLETLDLSHNRLVHLDTFQNSSNIRKLNLSLNALTSISTASLEMMANLISLDLSGNRISYIHPWSFKALPYLQELYLHNNQLSHLDEETVKNSTLQLFTVGNNPWNCHCGLEWLSKELGNSDRKYINVHHIICHSPSALINQKLLDVSLDAMLCSEPEMSETEETYLGVPYHSGTVIDCNVTGYPKPSVYWLTPRGEILALDHELDHIDPVWDSFTEKHSFVAMPYHRESRISILNNGSLHISYMRQYFSGRYQCIAENPQGRVNKTIQIQVTASIHNTMVHSVILGWITIGGCLVMGTIIGFIRMIVDKYKADKHDIYNIAEGEDMRSEPDHSLDDSHETTPCVSQRSLDSVEVSDTYITPCTTPSEGLTPDEDWRHYIKLEDVTGRLRSGMEKQVGRIRTRAAHVRDTSHKRIQNIRESSSQYMHTIRENIRESSSTLRSTSERYSHKVRAGVVMGVEHVKYHVQSIKELCGPGAIGQTISISTITVSTDIDSQERKEIVRTKLVTYV